MNPMAEVQGKQPVPRPRWGRWFSVGVLLAGFMVYFFYAYPGQGIGPRQPIPFSHRVHAGVKAINCRFCHPYVERSEHAGLPEMEKCFFCHKYIIPTHPMLLKEKEHLTAGGRSPGCESSMSRISSSSDISRICASENWIAVTATGRWSGWTGCKKRDLR